MRTRTGGVRRVGCREVKEGIFLFLQKIYFICWGEGGSFFGLCSSPDSSQELTFRGFHR